MKLQSPTLALVLVAMALGGFVAVNHWRQADSSDTTNASQSLFDLKEADVDRLTIETADQRLEFEKEGGEWLMRSPNAVPADASTVVFLVNLMTSSISDRVFEVDPDKLKDFGLRPPLATVEVETVNHDIHRLILGGYDFDRSNIYAQTENVIAPANQPDNQDQAKNSADQTASPQEGGNDQLPAAETVEVFIVSPSFESAVNRPIEDWLQRDDPEPTDPSNTEPSSDLPETTEPEVTGSDASDAAAETDAATP